MSMPDYPPYQPHSTADPYSPRRGIPMWVKVLIGLVVIGGLAIVGACAGLFYFLATSPETYVVSGTQLPDAYVRQIRDLGLLDADEDILLFYSDGLFAIDQGMYFITDSHLTLYRKD